jgi:hypothetical protein
MLGKICDSLSLPLLTAALSAILGGCGPGFAWYNRNQTLYGPTPILDDSVETINLTKLMSFGDDAQPEIKDWDAAFAAFDKRANSLSGSDQKKLRNEVQDRIVAASNQRCGEYKNFLKQFDSETNTILGGLATAVGGAGAIFTHADTARALSGIAAIFSGWRAEVSADFFNNLTIQVVTKGIEAKRKEIYNQMLVDREGDLSQYSVQRAVGDAAVYHYNCSLIAGLEQAAQSIERAENPGLGNIKKALDNLVEIQNKIASMTPNTAEKPGAASPAPDKKDTPASSPEKTDTPAKP